MPGLAALRGSQVSQSQLRLRRGLARFSLNFLIWNGIDVEGGQHFRPDALVEFREDTSPTDRCDILPVR